MDEQANRRPAASTSIQTNGDLQPAAGQHAGWEGEFPRQPRKRPATRRSPKRRLSIHSAEIRWPISTV